MNSVDEGAVFVSVGVMEMAREVEDIMVVITVLGKSEVSVTDGKSEVSVTDGNSEVSTTDGNSEVSVTDGKSEDSITESVSITKDEDMVGFKDAEKSMKEEELGEIVVSIGPVSVEVSRSMLDMTSVGSTVLVISVCARRSVTRQISTREKYISLQTGIEHK